MIFGWIDAEMLHRPFLVLIAWQIVERGLQHFAIFVDDNFFEDTFPKASVVVPAHHVTLNGKRQLLAPVVSDNILNIRKPFTDLQLRAFEFFFEDKRLSIRIDEA